MPPSVVAALSNIFYDFVLICPFAWLSGEPVCAFSASALLGSDLLINPSNSCSSVSRWKSSLSGDIVSPGLSFSSPSTAASAVSSATPQDMTASSYVGFDCECSSRYSRDGFDEDMRHADDYFLLSDHTTDRAQATKAGFPVQRHGRRFVMRSLQ